MFLTVNNLTLSPQNCILFSPYFPFFLKKKKKVKCNTSSTAVNERTEQVCSVSCMLPKSFYLLVFLPHHSRILLPCRTGDPFFTCWHICPQSEGAAGRPLLLLEVCSPWSHTAEFPLVWASLPSASCLYSVLVASLFYFCYWETWPGIEPSS